MKTINTNDTLQISFITDDELKPTCIVLNRVGKFATIKLSDGEIVKRKVYSYPNCDSEFIYPYGKYSMCPVAKPINKATI